MSVYHLCITSGGDLVVLLPRSLALLLRELRRQRRDMLLSVETLRRRLSPDICCA